jgi:hypothetical protein
MLALLSVPVVACGARSWLPVPGDPADAGVDAASCMPTDVPVEPNVPNLYFVLDASGSMLENSKWPNVRLAVANLVATLADSARFGATVFPDPSVDLCAPGLEVMPLRLGDTLGETATVFLTATTLTPRGGTPTAATFRSLAPKLKSLPGVTYVILATDGGPNCDTALPPCSIDQCTSNIDGVQNAAGVQICFPDGGTNCCDRNRSGCLDEPAAAQAIADLLAAGVQTYVMGIPGSTPYTAVLDQLAIAGGTARAGEPRYYAVGTPDTRALESGLEEIARQVMKSCTILLGRSPADPNKVNVFVDGALVPSDGPSGWSLHGSTVTLAAGLCGSLQADASVPTVHVSEGCPTVH